MLIFKNKRSCLLYLFILSVIWLAIFAMTLSFIYKIEKNNKEISFQNNHEKIHSYLADSLKTYEVSIQSFSSYLATTANRDIDSTRSFSKQLRRHYPNIELFAIAKRIPHGERIETVEKMQAIGYKDFMLHASGYKSDQEIKLLPEKEFYYPVVFIEPEFKTFQEILGFDISESVETHDNVQEKSFYPNINDSIKPLLLSGNQRSYVLYQKVYAADNYRRESMTKDELYALIMVNTSKLIPDWVHDIEGLSVSIAHSVSELNDVEPIVKYVNSNDNNMSAYNWVLPVLSQSTRLENQFLPFILTTQYAMQWSDINKKSVMIYTIIALISFPFAFWITLSLYRNKIKLVYEQEKNSYLANYDLLTRLPNKNLARELFNQSSRTTKRTHKKLIVLYIDLDKFKQINDSYGHHIGDMLLQNAAARLKSTLRDSDILVRLHGDEFAIFLTDIDDLSNIDTVVEHTKAAFNEPFVIDDTSIPVSLSVGISVFPDDATTFDDLLGTSDRNMYVDKKRGQLTLVKIDD